MLPQNLQPMELSDLCMDTHHRGRVLRVRRVAAVVKLVTCSWTVVQEQSSGEMERLEVLLHKSNHGQDILESGSMFEIKEPYYILSDQGEPTLRIDHPSDLVVHTDIIRIDSIRLPPKKLAILEVRFLPHLIRFIQRRELGTTKRKAMLHSKNKIYYWPMRTIPKG